MAGKESSFVNVGQEQSNNKVIADVIAGTGHETYDGNISDGSMKIQNKGQELPEPIRHKGESKAAMPCLPYINLIELTTILRDPSMPSQKIMKEVADKIMMKSEESESDDGSVSSGGGFVGMKGLLDCIFEVSYLHEDSDSSEDDDDSLDTVLRQIPCNFCNKVFGSTMKWNTHVLVAHPQPEQSARNIFQNTTNEADRKDKIHIPRKRISRSTSKPAVDPKTRKVHLSQADEPSVVELPLGEENVPVGKRCASLSRSHVKGLEKSDIVSPTSPEQMGKEQVMRRRGRSYSLPTCDLVKESIKFDHIFIHNKTTEDIDYNASADLQFIRLGPSDRSKPGKISKPAVPRKSDSVLEGPQQILCKGLHSEKSKERTTKQKHSSSSVDRNNYDNPSTSGLKQGDAPSGKKRKKSLRVSNSKSTQENSVKELVAASAHKHKDTSETPTAEPQRSKRTRKATTRKSSIQP